MGVSINSSRTERRGWSASCSETSGRIVEIILLSVHSCQLLSGEVKIKCTGEIPVPYSPSPRKSSNPHSWPCRDGTSHALRIHAPTASRVLRGSMVAELSTRRGTTNVRNRIAPCDWPDGGAWKLRSDSDHMSIDFISHAPYNTALTMRNAHHRKDCRSRTRCALCVLLKFNANYWICADCSWW